MQPLKPPRIGFAIAIAALAALNVPAFASPRALRVAAVQLEVGLADVLSLEAFAAHMHRAAREAVLASPDLLVFPEYTGVLAGLIPYAWAVQGSSTAAEALERVCAREPDLVSLEDVFARSSDFALDAMRRVFGGVASLYGLTVVAGTCFVAESSGGRRALRNRALVFGPDGEVCYVQDKVYLTEFEVLLGIEPGDAGRARLFEVAGRSVGLTICRDTFFGSWDAAFAEADLWIDLKGNGELYGPEVAERFARALPVRLAASGVGDGLTVCLTGSLLEYVWEGPSAWLRREPDGELRTVRAAARVRGEAVLVAEVESGGGISASRPRASPPSP